MEGSKASGAQTVADSGESGVIDAVTTRYSQPSTTLLGPGDDAAVVAAPDGRVVVATDTLVQGVHFRFGWSNPDHIGRKAAAANLADIAAMGAVPTALVVGFAGPADTPMHRVTELFDGIAAEADRGRAGVVGGDMVRSEEMMVSITALGDLGGRPPVTRSGARPGDILAVCGNLGWAAAGLAVLGRGFRSPVSVVDAQRYPQPPYEHGPAAALAGATSMIDTSDGLLTDLDHLATASGVGFDVHTERLAVGQKLVDVAGALGADPLHWVLTGGEDHALLATFPSFADLPQDWIRIGDVLLPDGGVTVDGRPYQAPSSWYHWR